MVATRRDRDESVYTPAGIQLAEGMVGHLVVFRCSDFLGIFELAGREKTNLERSNRGNPPNATMLDRDRPTLPSMTNRANELDHMFAARPYKDLPRFRGC